ncbi:uncharacterized protein BYT42DRAFT_563728 [Radiomyces spectabilis]|uniref:uncharacterized protein n=1 Tax=Radiomyces spectabilis TaxID=64574 RepID=UPI00221F4C3F|nr:uncharacterized protein BYT42DRAFT_563728 [Radiomyces spectabilis]KAI8384813.1 hypothetical protein BYT42DRAFT_563728 [Radiomyces spectabilis]
MVHAMPLVQGAEFKILLTNNHVVLHGSADESAGVMLRGSVVLDCHETTKVRSVNLKFTGKVRVNWAEGIGTHQRQFRDEHTILEHEWSFLPPTRKHYQLAEGHYQWDFELPLPGDLPESVQHNLGQVFYRLKAVAERPTFSINYTDKKEIKITRSLLPSSLELTQSMVISNEWANKLRYDISVPSRVLNIGSVVPISFDLKPIAPDLKVRSVTSGLKEYITVSSGQRKRTEGRVIKFLRDDQFQVDSHGHWSKVQLLTIPEEESHQIKTNVLSDLIKIRHKLKFTVSLMNADGHISELRAAVPIIIAAITPDDDINALPAYEDAWKSMPYDPATIAAMVASGSLPPSLAVAVPNEAAFRARTTAMGDTESGVEEETSPWEGIDLSRVPSYTTATRSGRLYSFSGSSLPAYDTIAVPGRNGEAAVCT